LGLVVPEEYGGLGQGFLELGLLLEQIGRSVAPVPVLPAAIGALAIAEFGSALQRDALLPGVCAGDVIVVPALVEPGGEPMRPATTARPHSSGWVLDGLKTCIGGGFVADQLLVSASLSPEETGLFLVDPASSGVVVLCQDTISYAPEARVELTNVVVRPEDRIGDDTTLAWISQRYTAGVGAVAAGVAGESVRMTSENVKTREQFNRPIATFQAVGHRLADCFIDATAIRLTALKAAWALSTAATAHKEVAVAKFYAAEAGQRIARATVHLHGGVGVDRDYPLHRYYLWAKHLELTLGGASEQLVTLGAALAAEPASA
ncbi:acyl-CoA dehydrogenase family protein, partial [Bacillus subtilis]